MSCASTFHRPILIHSRCLRQRQIQRTIDRAYSASAGNTRYGTTPPLRATLRDSRPKPSWKAYRTFHRKVHIPDRTAYHPGILFISSPIPIVLFDPALAVHAHTRLAEYSGYPCHILPRHTVFDSLFSQNTYPYPPGSSIALRLNGPFQVRERTR